MRIPSIAACSFALTLGTSGFHALRAQTVPVIHWINDSGQNGSVTLDNTSTFTTTFRSPNDVTVTLLAGNSSGQGPDNFGSPPGNNPSYFTTFVGSSSNGTGTGATGFMDSLNMASGSTGSLRFDFAQPLTSRDRLVFIDTDSNEQYRIQAFSLVSGVYVQLSLLGWTYEEFSGQTGITPDNRWPTWDPINGTLTASSSALNEELAVLTPDLSVDRLVISKLATAGFVTAFQVVEPVPEPTTIAAGFLAAVVSAMHLLRRRSRRRGRAGVVS